MTVVKEVELSTCDLSVISGKTFVKAFVYECVSVCVR